MATPISLAIETVALNPAYTTQQSHELKRQLWFLSRKLRISLIGRERYEWSQFWRRVGYRPDLKNPRTFNEKLAHFKLYGSHPLAPGITDKYAARDYVRERGGGAYLTPLYDTAETVDGIDFEALLERFVAKTAHGSAMNVFVHAKSRADINAIRAELHYYASKPHGHLTNEWWYSGIRPRILIEEYLGEGPNAPPLNYRFFCFHGVVRYIEVDCLGCDAVTFYDSQWRPQPFSHCFPRGEASAAPTPLDEMLGLATKLARGFDFLRVDLYCLNDRDIRFGELTLAPAAGWGRFLPDRSVDEMLGALW